jgi:hypothetical protein
MAARSALDVEIGLDVSGRALTLDPQPHPSDRLSHVSRHTIGMSSMPWREAPDSLAGRGGHFWYASDETATLEYLATFRRDPREGGEMTS